MAVCPPSFIAAWLRRKETCRRLCRYIERSSRTRSQLSRDKVDKFDDVDELDDIDKPDEVYQLDDIVNSVTRL